MKLKVGDIVKVFQSGGCFCTYAEWAKAYGLKNFRDGSSIPINEKYRIIVIADHLSIRTYGERYYNLLGLRSLRTGQEYIYSSFYESYLKKHSSEQLEFSF